MTEKEKMINEVMYDAGSEELVKEREYAKSICFKYNSMDPINKLNKDNILKSFLGKTEEYFNIEASFYCDYGYNIELGENFYANHNLVILDCAKVKFGNNVLIGPNCGFYTAGHPTDVKTRMSGLEFAKSIIVGDNVWFGGNVTVLPGVTIGNGSVIGAGSVVTKSIPSNVIAFGNPCKIVKNIE